MIGSSPASIIKSGKTWRTAPRSEPAMSVNREGIFCSRIVFADSEFNAYKGQGKRPGFPLCFCAIEFFFQNGRVSRVIEHRLSAPYPAKPPWERGDPYPFIGWAISAEAGSIMNINIPDWT